MANELMPKNLNMLRYLSENLTPEERRKMMLMGGDAEPDFATQVAMLNQQDGGQYAMPDRQSPFQASLMGNSGGYNMQLPNGQVAPFMPEMMQGRMGYQNDNLRAGASGMMVRMPDGTVKMMPVGLDAGYNTDLGNGGNFDIGGMYGPRGMFNVNARYSKKF